MNTTDSEFSLVMMRMANIMLLRAEALNKLNRGDEALNIVNDIRTRVGYLKDAKLEVSNVNNVNEVENIILQERQLELYGEGYRWFDLMRTGHLIEVMDPIYSALPVSSGRYVAKQSASCHPIFLDHEKNCATPPRHRSCQPVKPKDPKLQMAEKPVILVNSVFSIFPKTIFTP